MSPFSIDAPLNSNKSCPIISLLTVFSDLMPYSRSEQLSLTENLHQGLLQDLNPFGIAREEWTQKWWLWLLSIPKSVNPAADLTGIHSARNQDNPNVWFMAGTLGGSAERECTVPSSKAILLPIINDEQSFAERPEFMLDSEIVSLVKSEIDGVKEMGLTIDGTKLTGLNQFRVQTKPFDVTLPVDNIWGVRAGPTRAAADGYWLFLKPLSVGNHTIHVFGRGAHFETEIKYHVMVTRAGA